MSGLVGLAFRGVSLWYGKYRTSCPCCKSRSLTGYIRARLTAVQDSSGPVVLNSLTPASSRWFLSRMRLEGLVENLENSWTMMVPKGFSGRQGGGDHPLEPGPVVPWLRCVLRVLVLPGHFEALFIREPCGSFRVAPWGNVGHSRKPGCRTLLCSGSSQSPTAVFSRCASWVIRVPVPACYAAFPCAGSSSSSPAVGLEVRVPEDVLTMTGSCDAKSTYYRLINRFRTTLWHCSIIASISTM